MARNFGNRLRQAVLELNLFKESSSDAQTLPKERLATRIYICALCGLLFVITVVAALIVRTVEKTEYSPSHTKFLQLMQNYPNTLHCPCSKVSIAYDTFVTTRVNFHQVCSSQFIQQTWIDSIFTKENISFSSIDDFRVILSFFWQTVAGLCAASNRTWYDAATSFGTSRIFTPTALAEKVIRNQVKVALTNQIAVSRTALSQTLVAIQRMTSGNQIVSGLQTNFYLRYPPEDLGPWNSPKMSPRMFDDCSCLDIEGCPRPATFTDSHDELITIPGMIADCLIINSVLASTFECYYNQTCLSLLHDSLCIHIEPLSNNANNHFSLNSTVEMLLNEIMIDERTNEIRFDLFYTHCNPAYCFYSYTHRFDILFIVTIIIGIFGSLSLGLQLIAPLIATLILRWKNRVLPNANMSIVMSPQQNQLQIFWGHIRRLSNKLREKIRTLNLFEDQTIRTPTNIYREQLLTRFFIFLIIITSIAVGLHIFFVKQDQLITTEHPTLAIYRALYNEHPTTLKCPCSQLSVPYQTFLNVTFVLHQVCASDLVSQVWIKYLTSFDPTLISSWTETEYSRDFRIVGASYFQLLATLCSMVRINIENAQRVFINTQFINDRVVPPPLFIQQTNAIIALFTTTTRSEFAQIFNWINVAFASSQFFNGENINANVVISDDDQVTIDFPIIWVTSEILGTQISFRGPCSCKRDALRGCTMIPELYTNESHLNSSGRLLFFHVLDIHCIPLIGFTNSKIVWWYNLTYFEYIQTTYSMVIDSQPPPDIKPLDASITSQFGDVFMINLIREMMLETMIFNNASFDQFYYECAPSSCSYTENQRRDLIVVLLLLIFICGGLNEGLQMFIPLIGKLIFFCIDQWKNRNTQHARLSINNHLRRLPIIAYQSIKTLNLFKTTTADETHLRQQQIYTRVYLFFLISFLGVLLFYTAVIERTITKTHLLPLIEDYEQLVDLYSYDVSCPCTYVSIPYSEFITDLQVDAFHNACEDDAAEKILTSGSSSFYGAPSDMNDFTSLLPSFFTTLEYLCTLAEENVNNSIATFRSSTMLVNQLMTRTQFIDEMNQTLNQFEKKTPIAFARTLDLIRTTTQGNALMSLSLSNWNLVIAERGKGKNASFLTVPVIRYDEDQNTTCSCATLRNCTIPMKVTMFDRIMILDGFAFGCHLLETVLLSSFSCLYSDTCINYVRLMVGGDYVLPEHSVKLNASSTRFSINDTIETIANEMFIESWTNNVSYERFFNSCAPSHCTYIYHYRFDALELLTIFLSVFSGLSVGLRFIVPHLIQLIKKIRNRCRVAPLQ